MKCNWCNNPEDLLVESYDNYCFKCYRYSFEVPEGYQPTEEETDGYETQQGHWNPLAYLDRHACVHEYTFNPAIEYLVFFKCVNPVRAEKSLEYDIVNNRCRKNGSLTTEEYKADEQKDILSRRLHSYEFQAETRLKLEELMRIKEEKRAVRMSKLPQITEEDYKDDPLYQQFLKFKENSKV